MSRVRDDTGKVVAFVCDDKDMRAGGMGPLPRDPRLGRKATDAERPHVRTIFDALQELKKLGWREVMYAPQDHTPLWLIEPGSTGVHEGYRDGNGTFWVCDGDVWPSRPILFMKREEAPA